MEDKKYSLKIGHLYPDLLNLYGDRGNVSALVKRMEWRGFGAETVEFNINSEIDFSSLDIVILGGGSEREQLMVLEKLKNVKEEFTQYVENGGVVLAFSGGFQLLGKFIKIKNQTIETLGIMDFYTESSEERLISNVVLDSDLFGEKTKIVGFENHSGRTYAGNLEPLGRVLYGNGNNGRDKKEGAIYKNVIGTYLHGPLLPKNPKLTDYVLKKALEKKYGEEIKLSPIDDTLENKANEYIVKRFCK